ncbi:DUF3747 domain-containing protein [Candidatus Synechococcus calcipolaris G9]|uniref:DUF3747 domain-containing protein n=1 Tax=Candidatus Synechococcus calcipolaris G9 TaxID=1497997 RepID=A0ABT6F2X5_9SYNE|nr:DUF3747 domain-containing protein [Candidatus Synechococcus calcipolaris]MDG2992226.1 DUF3747 domain-containing protein [Candidatus Synechococcus calcipolaris G9]
MKSFLQFGMGILAATLLGATLNEPASASLFEHHEVEQTKYAAIAMPLARGGYRLLVVEQISDQRQCWAENGSAPVIIDPLLATFDFTGICGRSTDSNGYSIRVAQQDLGLQYSLRVEQRGNELYLVGASNRGGETMVIGRTYGMVDGQFHKFILEPTWRFARRGYEGRVLGHVYFKNDSWEAATGSQPEPIAAPMAQPEIPSAVEPSSVEETVTVEVETQGADVNVQVVETENVDSATSVPTQPTSIIVPPPEETTVPPMEQTSTSPQSIRSLSQRMR